MSQFESLELNELISAKAEIETLIKQRKKEIKSELLRDFRQKAESLGIDFNELVAPVGKKSSTTKKSIGKVLPKYRNPANADETWTGRGKKPQWVVDTLAEGRSLEDAAIS